MVSRPLFEVIEPVVERLSYLKTIIVVGGEDAATPKRGHLVAHRFEDVLARDAPDPFKVTTLSDEVAFWLYSSGSTGDPKGVKHVHTTMLATARHFGQETLGIRRDDVVFSAGKLFFAYNLANSMAFPMSVGATTVSVPDPATPSIVIETMRRYRPTRYFSAAQHSIQRFCCIRILVRALAPTDCASAPPAAIRCPQASASTGARSLASTSSRARARPEMLTFLSNRPDDIR